MALDLALLPDGGVPWLVSTGEHADIVLSSRIRLARNIAGFNFSARERDGERLRILASAESHFSVQKSARVIIECSEQVTKLVRQQIGRASCRERV